ncbi:MAG: ribosome silencing factor [Deltaproteobacteria bacterium]|nr:ribosome silencing factor [Deltaproteobacteria bacterium]
MNARQKALLCRKIAEDRKGINPLILDLRRYGTLTDFFVIVSGASDRQVSALVEEMQKALGQKDLHPHGIEGVQAARWILLDYDDVVVHIFQEADRAFYDLEGLWSNAPRV